MLNRSNGMSRQTSNRATSTEHTSARRVIFDPEDGGQQLLAADPLFADLYAHQRARGRGRGRGRGSASHAEVAPGIDAADSDAHDGDDDGDDDDDRMDNNDDDPVLTDMDDEALEMASAVVRPQRARGRLANPKTQSRDEIEYRKPMKNR